MATGELTLLKRQPVLPSPSGEPYRPEDYEQHREWAVCGRRHPDPDLAGLPQGHAS